MADVLLISMRDDAEAAESLSRTLEAAGFSVTRRLKDARDLNDLHAVVIAWTETAAQSLAMVEAGQKAAESRKAVIARFSRKPTPLSLRSVPTVDLSMWTGDPGDPFVAPLLDAVRRLAPAPPAPPPPPAAPTPEQSLAAEAAHWRQIKDSRDPVVFLEYLETFGRSGAFAEVAMMRLRALETGHDPRLAPLRRPGPRAQPAPPPPPPEPPPPTEPPRHGEPSWSGWSVQARPTPVLRPGPTAAPPPAPPEPRRPPPRREPPPPVDDLPPLSLDRPSEPPPTRRRRLPDPVAADEPWRAAPPEPEPPRERERDRERERERLGGRTESWREPLVRPTMQDPEADAPPPRRGAPMALVLLAGLAVLGVGAVFADRQFGIFGADGPNQAAVAAEAGDLGEADGGLRGERPPEIEDENPRGGAEGAEPPEEAPSMALAEAIAPEARASGPAPRTATAESFAGPRDGGRDPRRGAAAPESAPAPLPIDLGEVPNELPPPSRPAVTTLASAETSAPPPAIAKPGPVWATRFGAKDLAEVYPDRAARAGLGGKVMLACTVQPDFSAACRILSEAPNNEGFGRAALRAASRLKAEPVLADGSSSIGSSATVSITFFPTP